MNGHVIKNSMTMRVTLFRTHVITQPFNEGGFNLNKTIGPTHMLGVMSKNAAYNIIL